MEDFEQMQAERTERAREALARGVLAVARKAPGFWLVQTGDGLPYEIRHERAGWTCNCPDYERFHGQVRCKHVEAIRLSEGEQAESYIQGEIHLENNGKPMDVAGGWVTLFHPAGGGVQVTLPVPMVEISRAQARALYNNIDLLLGAGFRAQLVGLEEGEKREAVTHLVRRRKKEDDGSYTPIFDVYTGGNFRLLSVYLDAEKLEETAEFVALFGPLERFHMVYPGNAPLERGKDTAIDREYVFPVADCGVQIVYRANPKYDESEAEKAAAEKRAYRVAKRIFVRFEQGAPPGPANGSGPLSLERQYGNGDPVGEGAEAQAYDRHLKAKGAAPLSKGALRAWLKANPA